MQRTGLLGLEGACLALQGQTLIRAPGKAQGLESKDPGVSRIGDRDRKVIIA